MAELRIYATQYPIDDEANVWLPSALLRSQLANMLRAPDSPIALAKDFMPFLDADEEAENDPGQMLMDNWSKW